MSGVFLKDSEGDELPNLGDTEYWSVHIYPGDNGNNEPELLVRVPGVMLCHDLDGFAGKYDGNGLLYIKLSEIFDDYIKDPFIDGGESFPVLAEMLKHYADKFDVLAKQPAGE
jgi:hypothetical protein